MYALKKGKLYVAKPGREKSYTNKLEHAQKFTTREQAIQYSCPDNEFPVELSFYLLTEE